MEVLMRFHAQPRVESPAQKLMMVSLPGLAVGDVGRGWRS